jgi:hypothetical protein
MFGEAVDCDMNGKSVSDVDVLLCSAHRNAVMRLVDLAVQRQAGVPVTTSAFPALADEAFAQEEDFNFAGGQIIDYSILLDTESGYGELVFKLVNLAVMEADKLR